MAAAVLSDYNEAALRLSRGSFVRLAVTEEDMRPFFRPGRDSVLLAPVRLSGAQHYTQAELQAFEAHSDVPGRSGPYHHPPPGRSPGAYRRGTDPPSAAGGPCLGHTSPAAVRLRQLLLYQRDGIRCGGSSGGGDNKGRYPIPLDPAQMAVCLQTLDGLLPCPLLGREGPPQPTQEPLLCGLRSGIVPGHHLMHRKGRGGYYRYRERAVRQGRQS